MSRYVDTDCPKKDLIYILINNGNVCTFPFFLFLLWMYFINPISVWQIEEQTVWLYFCLHFSIISDFKYLFMCVVLHFICVVFLLGIVYFCFILIYCQVVDFKSYMDILVINTLLQGLLIFFPICCLSFNFVVFFAISIFFLLRRIYPKLFHFIFACNILLFVDI